MTNKLEFLKGIFGDYQPKYDTIKSIKLISAEDEDGYRAVYLNIENDSPVLTLILKQHKTDKEKEIHSFPAYIDNGMIWLRVQTETDFADKDNFKAYMVLKEFEADLLLAPELLEMINKFGFKYIPRSATEPGGEPSVSLASLRKSLRMPEDTELSEENLIDFSVLKDYLSDKSPARHKLAKKSKVAVFNKYCFYGFGKAKPCVNIIHSPLHPLRFETDEKGNEVMYGNLYHKCNGKKPYFLLKQKEDATDILVKYKGEPNIEHGMLISTGVDFKNRPYAFVIKDARSYTDE